MTRKTLALLLVLMMLLTLVPLAASAEDAAPLLTSNGEKLVVGVPSNAMILDYETNDMTLWLEEVTGIDLEFFIFPAGDEGNTKLRLMIASEETLPDVILNVGVGDASAVQQLADAGAIIPLDEYFANDACYLPAWLKDLEETAPHLTFEEYMTYTKGSDGYSYAFCSMSYAQQNTWNRRSWINKAWLDQLNLPEPKTIEELEYALTQFVTTDMNGNGIQDEIGAVGDNGLLLIRNLMNMFCYVSDTTNGYYYYLDEEGKIQPQFISDEWRKGLATLNEWVEKGLISTQTFSQDNASLTAIGCANPMLAGIVANNTAGAIASNRPSYTGLGIVEGPDGVGYATFSPINPKPVAVVSSSCKNPELAFKFLDFLSGKDANLFSRYGRIGVDFEVIDGDNEYKTYYSDIDGSKVRILLMNDFWGTPTNICWYQAGPAMLNSHYNFPGDVTATNTNGYMNAMHFSKIYPEMHRMDGLYYNQIIYTAEETETWADTRSTLMTFLNEQMTYFVLGTADVNDDAAWNSYLKELDNIGYQELIEADQIALDRTLGK